MCNNFFIISLLNYGIVFNLLEKRYYYCPLKMKFLKVNLVDACKKKIIKVVIKLFAN